MNEVTSWEIYDYEKSPNPLKSHYRYTPTGRDIENHIISIDALHYGGVKERDAHNIYATLQARATNKYFTERQNKRPVIISRSGYAGIGKYGSRWLGDNQSTAEWMGYSIIGLMAQNMMGIQLTGSEVCGFNGNATAELCARWYVLGAFYPFSRNHNAYSSVN